MSDRLKNTKTVSNENVIDDLTQDLELEYALLDIDPNKPTPGTSFDDASSAGDAADKTDLFASIESDLDKGNEYKEFEQNFDKDKNNESDTDSIDEEALKESELELNDDQREERRLIAEELKTAGNNAFKDGEYKRSIEKYTEGLKVCPLQYTQQRSILYCNRSAAKMKLTMYDRAIRDCTKAIELDEKYLKAYIRRAQSYEHTDKLDESLADYKKILELDPSYAEARAALVRLPPMIEEKNEKLKKEMMGKLKDLGNMILKPFGLSTDNFQLEQDPETQGYKINFKQ